MPVSARVWSWGSGGSREAAGAVSVGSTVVRRRRAATASVAVELARGARDLVGQQTTETRARRARATRGTGARSGTARTARATRTTPRRPHGAVVVVVGRRRRGRRRGRLAGLFWAGVGEDGVVGAVLDALLGVGDLGQPLLEERLRRVAEPLPPLSVFRMVGMSLSERIEEARRRIAALVQGCDAPKRTGRSEWLATMRRQMPASRSRRRPAT